MIEAIKIWNEPNNLSHWDFQMDPEWKEFAEMARLAALSIREANPALPIIMGGISPIDPTFIQLMDKYRLLQHMDAVAIHGFPLDWNHWQIHQWPEKVDEIRAVTRLPVWITEVGVSSFGAEEVQVFGIKRTLEVLRSHVDRIYWYSLLDLPQAWGATTRHKENEGSSYYRHFYMGLVRPDNTPKPALEHFDPAMGICQWFHYEDPRLEQAVQWLRTLGVRRLRTGISWADWLRPDALKWFDHQARALEEFDTTITLCFTPPSLGRRACHTSPPVDPSGFAEFAKAVVERYAR